MRAFVFTDASLKGRAGQFVWLSIDTEKARNAGFLEKHPVEALPSFFVLEPDGKVALKFVGGASVQQVGRILDDGRRRVAGGEKGLNEILARADRAYGENRSADAARGYREALAKAPEGWPGYSRAIESLLFALQRSKELKSCAETARDAYPKLRQTSSAANVAGAGLDCALSMKEEAPERPALLAALASDAREVVATRRADLAVDDISSLCLSLADEREAAKDDEGRRRILSELATYLEGEAARAKTPQARTVFDAHRMTVYRELEEHERAIPMLEQSERDFPDDYNPPARLAAAYKALKRWDEALAASDRALQNAYGPRKIGILTTRADIYAGKGDTEAAKRTIEQALAEEESFPLPQRSEATISSLKKKLVSLSEVSSKPPRPC